MLKKLLIAAVLMGVTLPAGWGRGADGPVAAGGPSGTTDVLTAAQMQADFDLMRHALEEARPGPSLSFLCSSLFSPKQSLARQTGADNALRRDRMMIGAVRVRR